MLLKNDFIIELEKKELEDIKIKREKAVLKLNQYLESHKNIDHKSIWADMKSDILQFATKDHPDIRNVLEENDLRRTFTAFIDNLEYKYKQEKKLKRMQIQSKLDKLLQDFRLYLEKFVNNNYAINEETRWKDFVPQNKLEQTEVYSNIMTLLNENKDLDLHGDCRQIFQGTHNFLFLSIYSYTTYLYIIQRCPKVCHR